MPLSFRQLPPQEELVANLCYDPMTGELTHKFKKTHGRPRVKRSGVRVMFNYRGPGGERSIFLAHRLIWKMVNGDIPEGMEIDHVDGDPSNNCIKNLRLANSSQQKMNRRVQRSNRSGLKGAFYHASRKGKKWRTQIKRPDGVLQFIGYFHTAQEAHEAYMSVSREVFGEFHREVTP